MLSRDSRGWSKEITCFYRERKIYWNDYYDEDFDAVHTDALSLLFYEV